MTEGLDPTKKIGAFPVYGWAAIGVVGIGAGYFISKKLKGSTAAAQTQNASQAAADAAVAAGATLAPSGLTMGYGTSGSVTTTPNTGGTSTTSNAQWSTEATNYLISQGYDPLAAQQAIAAYMGGNALTPGQQLMVSSAIGHFGSPPEGSPILLPSPNPTDTSAVQSPTAASTVPAGLVSSGATTALPAPPAPPAGEQFVSVAYTQSGRGAWYLTNLGGVYTVGDAPARGSYLGLPDSAHQGSRDFGIIEADPGDHYTIISTKGERYQF